MEDVAALGSRARNDNWKNQPWTFDFRPLTHLISMRCLCILKNIYIVIFVEPIDPALAHRVVIGVG